MLLSPLVVRSNTQKEMHLPKRAGISPSAELLCLRANSALYEDGCCRLHGTDKRITVAIEGIVAHDSGGDKGKILVF